MKVVTMYFADDGKCFSEENECREYEKQAFFKKILEQVPFWDYLGHRISPIQDAWDWEKVMAFQVENEEQFDAVSDLMDEAGLWCIPNHEEVYSEGLYYWDRCGDTWRSTSLEKKKLAELEAKFS